MRANGVAWSEVPSLYNQAANARFIACSTRRAALRRSPPATASRARCCRPGTANILANYRIGLGAAGNVAAGTITTLVDRPLGVAGVVNPLAANGGQDPDSVDDIQTSAPLTVVTLGRAVSIEDYQIFAETYAGIGKASAIWIPSGRYRGVFITVAAAAGEALPPGSQTLANLVTTLQSYGNPNIAIYPQSFLETIFRIEADLAIDPAYVAAAVQANVTAAALRRLQFCFARFWRGGHRRRDRGADPGCARHRRGQRQASKSGRHHQRRRYRLGRVLARAYKPGCERAHHAAAAPAGGANEDLPLHADSQTHHAAATAEILVLDPDPQQIILGTMS